VTNDASDRVQRLAAAIELSVAQRSAPQCTDAELLARHPELRELLEPLLAAAAGVPVEAAPDRTFGPFRLLRELARGGMGVVHDALQPGVNRRVALKLLGNAMAASPAAVARFRREAELAARLRHAHIVPVHDAGVIDGVPWLAMERVDGGTLAHVLRALATARAPLEGGSLARAQQAALGDAGAGAWLHAKSHVEASLRVLLAVADALVAAHAVGILHRDVKPANILLRVDGTPLLADFGLARDEQDPALSRTGEFAGTPYYVAPEQAAGDRARVGPAADVFALGVVAYELLLRERPFEGATSAAVLERVRYAEPPALQRRDHGLPADLVAVLDKALRKDPAERYRDMAAFAADLRAVLELRPVAARRRSALARTWRRLRRGSQRAAPVALALALAATAGGSWLYLGSQSERIRAGAAVELAPRIDAALHRVLMLHDTNDHRQSLELALAADRLLPDQPEVLAAVCLAANAARDAATAREFVARLDAVAPDVRAQLDDPAAATEPATAVGWFARGRALLLAAHAGGERELYARAASCLRRAVDRAAPPRQIYHCELLHALVHVGATEPLLAFAADLHHRWPDSPFVAYWRGFALEDRDPERAIDALGRAAAGIDDLPQPRARLAQALEKAGRWAEAVAAYDVVLARWPGHGASLSGRAQCLSRLGRGTEALAAIDAALAGGVDDYWAHTTRGQILRRLRRPDDAAAAFQIALRRNANAALPWRARAELRLDQGQHEAALADAERACRLEPENIAARGTLGIALLYAQRPRDAAAAFEAVVAAWPWSDEHWRHLAQARCRDGQHDAAETAIARALALRPDDPANVAGLGKIQQAREQHAAAAATFERVLALAPANYEALVNLAGLRWRGGEREDALALLARARATAPELEPAWEPSFRFLAAIGRPREGIALRCEYLAQRPRHRAGRIALVQRVLGLPAAPGDAELLARTFTELDALDALDGGEREDVAALRKQAAARLAGGG
jgi:serine/threonine protein kinase/tetratricopeptide (TPR) repeat protein